MYSVYSQYSGLWVSMELFNIESVQNITMNDPNAFLQYCISHNLSIHHSIQGVSPTNCGVIKVGHGIIEMGHDVTSRSMYYFAMFIFTASFEMLISSSVLFQIHVF